MKRLQVLIDNNWHYVFCRNFLKRLPILTENRLKAIRGNEHSLKYFQDHFSELQFRIVK